MRTCLDCGRPMVSRYVWKVATREQRAEHRARGVVGHQGCNLCNACHERSRKRGTERERTTVPMTDVAHEWEFLARRELSVAENVRRLAPRMGMTEHALEAAVYRARSLGLLEVA